MHQTPFRERSLQFWGNIRRFDEDPGKPGGGEGDLVLVGLVILHGNKFIADLGSFLLRMHPLILIPG